MLLDAFIAITYAIADRSLLRPFQLQLLDVLTEWGASNSGSELATTHLKSTLEEMRKAMEYCVRLTGKRDQPLFHPEEEDLPVPVEPNGLPDPPLVTADPGYVYRICKELDVVDLKDMEVVEKAWKRVVGCLTARRRGDVNVDEDEDGMQGGRSVRAL